MDTPNTSDSKKKSSLGNTFRRTFAFVLLAVFVIISIILYRGMGNTMSIVPKSQNDLCKGDTNCLIMDSTYEKGWAVWQVEKWIPFNFAITTSGYNEGQKLQMICPIDYKDGSNKFITKLKFLLQRNEDVKQCQVKSI
jgi:hypothetical protein